MAIQLKKKKKEEKMALFMKRIINFQQMIRCKEVLLREDWRIINLLRVEGFTRRRARLGMREFL